MFAINTENLNALKSIIIFLKKHYVCNKCGNEYKKIFKEEESIKILKVLV